MSEFHIAVGKFINYHVALEEVKPSRTLYLAVPLQTYNSFLQRPLAQRVIQDNKIKLIVYDPDSEEIVKWRN
ncbi:MAG: element excision factor XisH family protein [Pseudomonadota bacterium]